MEFNDSRSKEKKDYWTYLEDNFKEVTKWPTWMRGDSSSGSEKTQDSKETESEREENG